MLISFVCFALIFGLGVFVSLRFFLVLFWVNVCFGKYIASSKGLSISSSIVKNSVVYRILITKP